jgi:xanthine/uracil permease
MCHGAGGMADHVKFGARTGGALIILGLLLPVTAVFFSGSVDTFLRLFPSSILGVILFLTGAQLALGAGDIPKDEGQRFVVMATAALAVLEHWGRLPGGPRGILARQAKASANLGGA